jgi:DNA-binding transcriptional ArsR family regulator
MKIQIIVDNRRFNTYYLHEDAKVQTKMNDDKQRSASEKLSNCLTPGFFRALADPNRIAILMRLAQGEKEQTVTDVSCCCSVDISVVSRHLGILRDAGIVDAQKRGREVYYSVRVDQLTTLFRNLADALEACCPEGVCIQARQEDDPEQEA